MSKRYPGGFLTGAEPTVNAREAEGIWTLDQQAGYQGQGEWPPSQYQISRSLRFNSADSAYLSRTPASAGNRKTWTWSAWVKRSNLNSGELNYLFMAGVSGNETVLTFSSNDANVGADDSLSLYTYVSGFVWIKTTAQLFRDPSSWYHIVAVLDTDNAAAEDRARLYVNGVRVDTWEKNTAPSSGYASSRVNDTTEHDIGKANFANRRYNGLMTEIHFIDGQALTPSDFGGTNPTTGVWEPLPYIGTYGTNGFYLNFSNNSGVTAATLGADSSGNGNNWTPNNFSVTETVTTTTITGAYIYSTYAGGTRGADYSVDYSDDNVNWTSAFTGNFTTSSCGLFSDVGQGDGSYGAHRFWRYRVTAVTAVHHPRVSRIGLIDSNGNSTNIIVFVADNCSDSGTIPGGPYSYDFFVNGTTDSFVDTPTPYGTDTGAGGEVRGNYCTGNWNNSSSTDILTNGALDWGCDNTRVATGTFGMSSGKWYCEGTVSAITSTLEIGIVGAQRSFTNIYTAPGSFADGYTYLSGGNKYNNNSSTAYGASYTTNDVIGIAFDADAGTITFYKNGVSQGTAFSSVTVGTYVICARGTGIGPADFLMNFGQRPFAYTAPSGFKALCTQNLPTPTVVQGGDYFNTVLYTGNSSSTGATRNLTGVGFQPDFVWIKNRSNAYSHQLFDAIRGTGNKNLRSDSTSGEGVDGNLYGYLSSFDSDGFQVTNGSDASFAGIWVNQTSQTYVAWNWNAGGSSATNTDGTITSTVRANPTAGFSIATFTAPASGTFSIGHSLGVTPAMLILKDRSNTASWTVWHQSLSNPAQSYLALSNANGANANTTVWGNTAPTSSVVTLGVGGVMYANANTVAYCFAEVEGFSKFGSYTGNGIDNGPFVFCGFRPAFVMVKRFDTSGHSWGLVDMTRDPYNVCTKILQPNAPDKDYELETPLDALSNGFKVRDAPNSWNASGGTYIFVAFAENPFKYSLAR